MYKRKNTGSTTSGEHKSAGQKAVDKFTEMMITRMEEMKAGDWKKGWIDGKAVFGMPQNISGRNYSGSNSFFLQMDAAMHGYRTPVYMTFLQIQKEGAHVNKGATAMPVIYWDFTIQDKDGKRVSSSDYRNMSKEEQKQYTVIPFLKAYNVFNVEQTNLEEVHKEENGQILLGTHTVTGEQYYLNLGETCKIKPIADDMVMEQLDDNLRIFDQAEAGCLSEADKAMLVKVREAYEKRVRVGCTGCEYCQPCPQEVHIPDIFEAYNHAKMFDQPGRFTRRYADLCGKGFDASQCVQCGSCEAACPQHLSIIDWLQTIDREYRETEKA